MIIHEPKGVDDIAGYVKTQKRIISKLKQIVKNRKTAEEETIAYKYRGRDKDIILDCMAFFYSKLWDPNFRQFVFSDVSDDWENYHIQLSYSGKLSEVIIIYGIGAFCIIKPVESAISGKPVLSLDSLKVDAKGCLKVN